MSTSSNPFSACYIRPGAIPFRFPSDENRQDSATTEDRLRQLIGAWAASGFVGQITGPHGVGKSTLAQAIAARTANDFETRVSITIRPDSQTRPWLSDFCVAVQRMPPTDQSDQSDRAAHHKSGRRMLLIDGLERLSLLHRKLLLSHCRCYGIGLLATTHRPIFGLTTIYRLESTLETFLGLARGLMAQQANSDQTARFALTDDELCQEFEAANGNVREAFFCLYDRMEDNVA